MAEAASRRIVTLLVPQYTTKISPKTGKAIASTDHHVCDPLCQEVCSRNAPKGRLPRGNDMLIWINYNFCFRRDSPQHNTIIELRLGNHTLPFIPIPPKVSNESFLSVAYISQITTAVKETKRGPSGAVIWAASVAMISFGFYKVFISLFFFFLFFFFQHAITLNAADAAAIFLRLDKQIFAGERRKKSPARLDMLFFRFCRPKKICDTSKLVEMGWWPQVLTKRQNSGFLQLNEKSFESQLSNWKRAS